MPETKRGDFVQDLLADVTKRGVPQVMPQGNSLGQVLIEVQGTRYRAGDLGNLQSVGQSRYIVVTQGGNKDLGLMLKAAKGLAVNNAIPVALKGSTHGAGLLRFNPPLG